MTEESGFLSIPGRSGKDIEVDGGVVRVFNCGKTLIYVTAEWRPKRGRKPKIESL